MAAARELWRGWQTSLDPAWLVFIDETGTNTAMARRYGRARRGERLVAAVPHGHWKKPEWLDVLLDLDRLQEATVTRGSHSYPPLAQVHNRPRNRGNSKPPRGRHISNVWKVASRPPARRWSQR